MERPDVGAVDFDATLKRGLFVAVGSVVLVVGLIALAGVTTTGAEALGRIGGAADPAGLVAAVLLISTSQLAVAMRWRALMPPAGRPGPLWTTGVLSVGLVFNYALPGPVGELLSAAMVDRRTGVGFAPAFASLAASRVVGLASACVLAVVASPFLEDTGPASAIVLPASAALLVGGLGLGMLAVRPDFVLEVLARFAPSSGGLLARLHRAATDLATALLGVVGRGAGAWAQALGWALAGHAVVSLGITVAAWSIGAEPSFAGVLFTYGVATAGALLLFVFPGSHLGWDVTFAALLVATTGVRPEEAAVVTVIARLQQTALLGIGVALMVPFVRALARGRGPT